MELDRTIETNTPQGDLMAREERIERAGEACMKVLDLGDLLEEATTEEGRDFFMAHMPHSD